MSTIRKIIKKLLEEQGEDVSMVRLMCLLSLLTGIGVGCYGVYAGSDLSGVAQLAAVFVGAAFSAKVAQKFAEKHGE